MKPWYGTNIYPQVYPLNLSEDEMENIGIDSVEVDRFAKTVNPERVLMTPNNYVIIKRL